MKKELATVAILFLAAHLLYLPPTLEDIDSINFALGVRDFDVARHQPHPPGYPVFIALAKTATAALGALGVVEPVPRALALLSALAATALVPLLFLLFRRLAGDDHTAWWGMAVAVCCPLVWFTALRPLSDMTGLALSIGAQVCLFNAIGKPGRWRAGGLVNDGIEIPSGVSSGHRFTVSRWLVAGAALSGLAAGVRVQTVMLTAPLFLAALFWPATGLTLRSRLLAPGAAAAAVLLWAIPLLAASGGLSGYLAALGSQAGEDFSGVVMLWTNRHARTAAEAVLNSFVWPWRQYRFGVLMVVLAAAGAVRLGWRVPRSLVLAAIAFLPYAIFHLLFHETATMRYAMPLVIPVAFLAATAMAGAGRRVLTASGIVATVVSLGATIPAAQAYGGERSPAFHVLRQLLLDSARIPAGALTDDVPAPGPMPPVLAMHASMRRVEEWEHDRHRYTMLRAGHGREWLALVEHWRSEPHTPVLFLADPRRTDLALFDAHARTLDVSSRWAVPLVPFLAGVRPAGADGYVMQPPGWMLDKGWALTAEVAGVTARDALGPSVQPSIAWVRGRSSSADLIVGGRQVGGAAPARITVNTADRAVASWDVAPGFFSRRVTLPAGSLAASGYIALRVAASAADGSGRPVDVKLEQFDLQSDANVMLAYVDGWQEPEYNPMTSLAWRWMSERARLWLRPVGRDVELVLAGESPLKYFPEPPQIKVLAGGVELARFAPAADFAQRIVIPAAPLAAAEGTITIESSRWFTPAQRGESADQRHLALRIYSVDVR